MTRRITLKGYKVSKSGQIEKQSGYGKSVSQRIAQRTSKKQRVVRRAPG